MLREIFYTNLDPRERRIIVRTRVGQPSQVKTSLRHARRKLVGVEFAAHALDLGKDAQGIFA